MSLATHLILNHQTPTSLSFLSASRKLFLSNNTLTLAPKSSTTLSLSSLSSSLQFSIHNQPQPEPQLDGSDVEEIVIGDCLVFEEGIFEDPNIQQELTNDSKKGKFPVEVEPENLIPEKWKEVQEAINISKKERRKIAQQMEFGRRLEKKKQGLRPLTDQYVAYRDAKLSQLKPLILDTPTFPLDKNDDGSDKVDIKEERNSNRVAPRNPRLAVYGRTLEDVSHFLNSQNYDPQAVQNSDGPRKLFSKEEKVLMNRRAPDLAAATSGKWQPLHTLAASGEFYLLGDLLKHNVDINVPDKDGLTALHKAILGKKQAIFNYLLRESANPFVRDKEGATLMHYAVRTASSQMIKILLLYNVDINSQDNDGWTPLHLAVQSRRTDVVRLLLIKGADKTLKNRDGLTPLDICLYSGRDTRTYELIKLIKQQPKAR